MTPLSSIQTLVETLLNDYTSVEFPDYLNGFVVVDNGRKRNEIETLLRERGFAVVVHLPLKATRYADAPSVALRQVQIPVSVQLNSAIDSGKSAMDGVQCVFDAILSYRNEDDSADEFGAHDDAFELVVDDEGLVVYGCWFDKLVNL